MFNATVDLSEFRKERSRTGRELRAGVVRAVRSAADAGVAEAKRVGSWKDRTGATRSGIHATEPRSSGDGASADMVSPAAHSSFLESGTRPHIITARRAKFLRFTVGGNIIFARRVRHPGTRAYAFMGPAYIKAEASLRMHLEALTVRVGKLWN